MSLSCFLKLCVEGIQVSCFEKKAYEQQILFSLINLKLVSAIFHQIFIFSPNNSLSKTVKNIFNFI